MRGWLVLFRYVLKIFPRKAQAYFLIVNHVKLLQKVAVQHILRLVGSTPLVVPGEKKWRPEKSFKFYWFLKSWEVFYALINFLRKATFVEFFDHNLFNDRILDNYFLLYKGCFELFSIFFQLLNHGQILIVGCCLINKQFFLYFLLLRD